MRRRDPTWKRPPTSSRSNARRACHRPTFRPRCSPRRSSTTPRASWLCDVCETSGAIDQAVPFQCSTDAEFPTAAQLTGLGHDTPVRPANSSRPPIGPNAGGSAGLATIDHRDPFHCSTSCLTSSPVALGRIAPDRGATVRARARHTTQLRGEPAFRVGRRDDRPALAVPMFHQHTRKAVTDRVTVRRARTRHTVQTGRGSDPDRRRRNRRQG